MGVHKRRKKNLGDNVSYWQSYSDMMAAVLLVFVLILTFSMLESRREIEAERAQLEQQQALYAEQEELLKEQEAAMEEQQEQLDRVIGVKSDLVSALKTEFDGSDLSVYVDSDTGAITFDSNVLFDTGQYDIKPEGLEFLNQFLPRYFGVLLDGDFKEYVSEIIIEGHTDTNGSYLYNLELSQQRALSVASYCLKDDSKIISDDEIAELRDIVTANGRSYSDVIYNSDGSVDMDKSRRVEFKFRLKDEEMVQEMIDILNANETN
jgi:chemotaxis protein MotB